MMQTQRNERSRIHLAALASTRAGRWRVLDSPVTMSRAAAHFEKLAVETFSVVLGIVLALAVNAWHDDRVHRQQACEALRAIRSELSTNLAALRERAGYHLEM